jgi:AbiU2
MWTTANRARYDRNHLRYPSDLTDEEWALIESRIPPAKRGGNKRTVNVREIKALAKGLIKRGRIPVSKQTNFEKELEIFRTEEETAQQYFFSYLSIRDLTGRNHDVLRTINTTPLFWITTHHAMLLATFVALGRIFDQNSKHNIDRLISVGQESCGLFSKAALQARKQSDGLTEQQAASYVADAHELTATGLRTLRKEIAHWRRFMRSITVTSEIRCSHTRHCPIYLRSTSF